MDTQHIPHLGEDHRAKPIALHHLALGVGGASGCTLANRYIVGKGWLSSKRSTMALTLLGATVMYVGRKYDRPAVIWAAAGWTFAGIALISKDLADRLGDNHEQAAESDDPEVSAEGGDYGDEPRTRPLSMDARCTTAPTTQTNQPSRQVMIARSRATAPQPPRTVAILAWTTAGHAPSLVHAIHSDHAIHSGRRHKRRSQEPAHEQPVSDDGRSRRVPSLPLSFGHPLSGEPGRPETSRNRAT